MVTNKQKYNKKYGFKPGTAHSKSDISKKTGIPMRILNVIYEVRKLRGLVSEDEELSATLELLIELCNLLLQSDNEEIIKLIKTELCNG